MVSTGKKISPPELARRYGIDPAKVLRWIRCGELRAVNIASRPTGRPRFVIDEADIAAFELRRSAVAIQHSPTRRRRRENIEIIQFF